MTAVTIDRAVVEQALEALEKVYRAPEREEYNRVWWPACEDAITALRAAMVQPEGWGNLPPPLQAEPVTEDMKSAVRWAPSSAYWSERLREFFGPDAREGIDALERRIEIEVEAEREAIIQAMPGGHSVDPQWVCDMIRARSKE